MKYFLKEKFGFCRNVCNFIVIINMILCDWWMKRKWRGLIMWVLCVICLIVELYRFVLSVFIVYLLFIMLKGVYEKYECEK